MKASTPSSQRRIARRALVSGRVQGVFYRGAAQQRARAAGIAGHARNLPDGRVEVLAWGDECAVNEFVDWLWIGPMAAKVTDVVLEAVQLAAAELLHDFRTA